MNDDQPAPLAPVVGKKKARREAAKLIEANKQAAAAQNTLALVNDTLAQASEVQAQMRLAHEAAQEIATRMMEDALKGKLCVSYEVQTKMAARTPLHRVGLRK